MQCPDFKAAKRHILHRLEHDLPQNLAYHSASHTRDIVLPAIELFSSQEGVTGEDLDLLKIAAYFHDIGLVENYLKHEFTSERIARETLPAFGFTPIQIERISGIILATRLPQTPHTLLEEIMADADLDILGRDDFWEWNQLLRLERAAYNSTINDADWYGNQLAFMLRHHYFTKTAINLRRVKKQQHIQELRLKLKGMSKPRRAPSDYSLFDIPQK